LERAITAKADSDYELIYGFPNQQSAAVFRRLGYRELGEVDRWVKPLAWRTVTHRWPRLARLPQPAANLCDWLLRMKSPETYYRRPANVTIEMTDRFDARANRLWQRAAPQLGIAGGRTAEYLDWRFCHCPDVRYRVLNLCDHQGELLGYVV
jgi:hypothetical protein